MDRSASVTYRQTRIPQLLDISNPTRDHDANDIQLLHPCRQDASKDGVPLPLGLALHHNRARHRPVGPVLATRDVSRRGRSPAVVLGNKKHGGGRCNRYLAGVCARDDRRRSVQAQIGEEAGAGNVEFRERI